MSRNHDRMRDAGTAVLAKRGIFHEGCSECRRARAEGRRTMRFYLYLNLLEPELKAISAESGTMPMAKRLWHACLDDRELGILILRLTAKRILSGCRAALRWKKPPSHEA